MTNDSGNQEFSSFLNLSKQYQDAIVLKYTGKKYIEIASSIEPNVQEQTVATWFMAGGILEQAYREYAEKNAEVYFKETELFLKKTTLKAAMALEEVIDQTGHLQPRVAAANSVLNRFIPQRFMNTGGGTGTLPEQLVDDINEIVEEENADNDVPAGQEDSSGQGGAGDKSLPA